MALFLGILTRVFARIVKLARLEYRLAVLFAVLTVVILLHNVTEASLAREAHLLWMLLLFFYFFAYQRERDLRGAALKARAVSNMSPQPVCELPGASGMLHPHTIN